MKIDIETLKLAITRQLDDVARQKGTVVEVPDDLYWFVPVEEWADPCRTPSDLTLGSVADDWQQVAAIANGTHEPMPYALIWSAGVLRALTHSTTP